MGSGKSEESSLELYSAEEHSKKQSAVARGGREDAWQVGRTAGKP